jgi:hypothetical protein
MKSFVVVVSLVELSTLSIVLFFLFPVAAFAIE